MKGRRQAAGPTSGLVELQGDVRVEAQAEVVVEHIQGQLRRQEKVKRSHQTQISARFIQVCFRPRPQPAR